MRNGNSTRFLWGVATSSYQVEGGNTNNDWHYFTSSGAIQERILKLTTPNIFYKWSKGIQLQPAGDALRTWDPHYYAKDFELAKSLGLNSFKISIEWSRIQPEKNDWNQHAMDEYKRMIKAMKERGLNPIITIHHLTLPKWVLTPPVRFKRKIVQKFAPSPLSILPLKDPPSSDPFWKSLMGWENPDTVEAYLKFVSNVVSELKCHVDYWITLSEPIAAIIGGGYISGIFPPGFFLDGNRAKKVLHNLIQAHVAAYNKIKELDDCDSDGDGLSSVVGFSHLMTAVKPHHSKLGYLSKHNHSAGQNFCYFMNDYFINAVINGEEDINYLKRLERHNKESKDFFVREEWKNKADFIGMNYYRRVPVYYSPIIAFSSAKFIGGAIVSDLNLDHKNSHGLISDLGWEIYPKGLYDFLLKIKVTWNKPVLITENGIADKSDKYRPQFIISHIDQIRKAIDDKVRVIGYFHWSMMDNYEWQEGYSEDSRFGLFRVDRTGNQLERKITEGAKALKKIVQCSLTNEGQRISHSGIEEAMKTYGTISDDGLKLVDPT